MCVRFNSRVTGSRSNRRSWISSSTSWRFMTVVLDLQRVGDGTGFSALYQPGVFAEHAAGVARRVRDPGGPPPGQFAVVDQQIERQLVHVDQDLITVAHER